MVGTVQMGGCGELKNRSATVLQALNQDVVAG